MPISAKWAAAAAGLGAIAALAWMLSRVPARSSYTIDERSLTGWTLASSDGTDPWVVGLDPPESLSSSLFEEAMRRAGRPLIAPLHRAMPLVLRSEFDEGLQGVFGADSVLSLAREAGIETTRFSPVCLARRTAAGPSGPEDLYFVPFESTVFTQVRTDLIPAHPEQAGVGVYDPATLTPILIVGATDTGFDRWWPLAFVRDTDCIAPLETTPEN
ncbi:MAG TPA: hypothetical protein VM032_04955 [Vicinamibacterales bacterium]|nr:hypothetical protein [Vicinamibacterales bacterium]